MICFNTGFWDTWWSRSCEYIKRKWSKHVHAANTKVMYANNASLYTGIFYSLIDSCKELLISTRFDFWFVSIQASETLDGVEVKVLEDMKHIQPIQKIHFFNVKNSRSLNLFTLKYVALQFGSLSKFPYFLMCSTVSSVSR